jgi:hypothetical protein
VFFPLLLQRRDDGELSARSVRAEEFTGNLRSNVTVNASIYANVVETNVAYIEQITGKKDSLGQTPEIETIFFATTSDGGDHYCITTCYWRRIGFVRQMWIVGAYYDDTGGC